MKHKAQFILSCLLIAPLAAASAEAQTVADQTVLSAESATETAAAQIPDAPMGQGDATNVSLLPEDTVIADDDLFGSEGGYLHPYLTVSEAYTDNLFNVDTDTTSNFLTTISPGIWFALPRKNQIPVDITPHNTSPGGLPLQLGDYDGTDAFQLYALAGTDLLFYSEDSDLNTVNYNFEGLGRYNMASGLSLQILDRFTHDHDKFGVGSSTEENQREFDSNFVMATADWDLTEKLRVMVDVSNFYLGYDDSLFSSFDRTDNSADIYAFFKYSPKSSVFLEYKFTDVEYDTGTEKDNSQNFFYGGVRWDTTDKLSLLFKAGLQQKEFDNKSDYYDESDELTLDLQVLYRFTVKTEATLDLYRLNEESDSAEAYEKEVLGAAFEYNQEFTDKIKGRLSLYYENADYAQLIESDRTDDIFEINPALQYYFKEWLMAEISYSFEMDESSDDRFDYETNTIMGSINFAL